MKTETSKNKLPGSAPFLFDEGGKSIAGQNPAPPRLGSGLVHAAALVAVFLLFFLPAVGAGRAEFHKRKGPAWKLVYADDFDTETLSDKWERRGGKWSVENGELVVASDLDAFLLLNIPVPGDVRIEFDARCEKDEVLTSLEAAVFCNATKRRLTKDGYFASFGGTDGVKLQRRDYNVVFNHDLKPEPGRKFRLRLERLGGELTLYVDGAKAAVFRDALPLSRRPRREYVGLYVWNARTCFDRFRIFHRRTAVVPAVRPGDELAERGHLREARDFYKRLEHSAAEPKTRWEAAYCRARTVMKAVGEIQKKRQKKDGFPPTPEEDKQLAVAARILDRLVAEAGPPWRQYAQVARGEVECERLNLEKGIKTAVRGAEDDPILRVALRPLLARYIRFIHYGDFKAAKLCVEALTRLYPEEEQLGFNAAVNYAAGLVHHGRYAQGQLVTAKLLKKYVSRPKEYVNALLKIAHSFGGEGRYEYALQTYEKVLKHCGEDEAFRLAALLGKGEALNRLGRYQEALAVFEHLQKSRRLRDNARADLLLGKHAALAGLGRYKEALRILDELLRTCPRSRSRCATALVRRAALLFPTLGQRKEAAATTEKILTEYPDQRGACGSALIHLGGQAAYAGRWNKALELFEQAEKRFPEQNGTMSEAELWKGRVLQATGRAEEALRVFDEILARYPTMRTKCAAALLGKGTALGSLGRTDEALGVFDEILYRYEGCRSTCADAVLRTGRIIRALGRYGEAWNVFRAVRGRFPDQRGYDAKALLEMAGTLCLQKRYREALTAYLQVRREYPDQKKYCAEALLDRGRVFLKLQQFDEATAAYKKIAVTYPNFRAAGAAALIGLAEVQRVRKQDREAEKTLQRVFAEYPEQGEQAAAAWNRLAELYLTQGRFEKVALACRRLLQLYPDQRRTGAETVVLQGVALRRAGHLAEAAKVFAEAAKKYPEWPGTRFKALVEKCVTNILRGQRKAPAADLVLDFPAPRNKAAEVFRAVFKAVKAGKPLPPAPKEATYRDDYEFAVALIDYLRGEDAKAVAHLQKCAALRPEDAGEDEWPATLARELLRVWEKNGKRLP